MMIIEFCIWILMRDDLILGQRGDRIRVTSCNMRQRCYYMEEKKRVADMRVKRKKKEFENNRLQEMKSRMNSNRHRKKIPLMQPRDLNMKKRQKLKSRYKE